MQVPQMLMFAPSGIFFSFLNFFFTKKMSSVQGFLLRLPPLHPPICAPTRVLHYLAHVSGLWYTDGQVRMVLRQERLHLVWWGCQVQYIVKGLRIRSSNLSDTSDQIFFFNWSDLKDWERIELSAFLRFRYVWEDSKFEFFRTFHHLLCSMATGTTDYKELGDIKLWKNASRTHYPGKCGELTGQTERWTLFSYLSNMI